MILHQPTATSGIDAFSPFGYRIAALDSYAAPLLAWSAARQLRSRYTGKLLKVRRSSDSTLSDIGFTASGNLDTAALLAFCGAGDGFIHTYYDQSGNGLDMVQATEAEQIRIVNAGALDVVGSNNRPVGYCTTNGTGGYTHNATFADYSGLTLSAAAVHGIANSAVAAFIMAFAKGTSLATSPGGGRFARVSTTEQISAIRAAATTIATAGITYAQTKSIGLRYSGTDGYLTRAGSTATGATTLAWDISRVIVGGNSTTTQSMGAGDTHAEGAIWLADIGATALAGIMAEQEAYYGL